MWLGQPAVVSCRAPTRRRRDPGSRQSRVDNHPHRQSLGIDQGVDLAAFHLFAGVVTHLVLSTAHFSADFTDWLSRTSADGLTSRPIRSIHARRWCGVQRPVPASSGDHGTGSGGSVLGSRPITRRPACAAGLTRAEGPAETSIRTQYVCRISDAEARGKAAKPTAASRRTRAAHRSCGETRRRQVPIIAGSTTRSTLCNNADAT
jgi:hypothetical protein